MPTIVSASLVTSFFAGVAALFAPCCVAVLLPTYLASLLREKRKVLVMTLVFFLGLLTVFLPIGLAGAALGQILRQYHNAIYLAGSIFLILLGASLVFSFRILPGFNFHPSSTVGKNTPVYVLGVFSGLATLCCAPVLAGIVALTVLPGSVFWGLIYTLAYTLGIVAPLVAIALTVDKLNLTEKFMVLRKTFTYRIGKKTVQVRYADLLAGVVFLAMGLLILYLSMTNQLFAHSGYQTKINLFFANLTKWLTQGGR